jgi:hypothetical protein
MLTKLHPNAKNDYKIASRRERCLQNLISLLKEKYHSKEFKKAFRIYIKVLCVDVKTLCKNKIGQCK